MSLHFFKQTISAILIVVLLSACQTQQSRMNVESGADTLTLKYAKGFQIIKNGSETQLTIFNPWQKGQIYAQYTLGVKEQVLSSMHDQQLNNSFQVVGAFSSTVIGYLKLLGKRHIIKGITDGAHVYDSTLYAHYSTGKVKGLGQNMVDNFEAILDLNPDALFKSGFEQSPSQDERYLVADIPVIYVNDWMESHPLARAEWIKFVACFFDKAHEADSIFEQIENRYLAVKEKAQKIEETPSVMAGGAYKGTWYVPGGRSYFANFLADARSDYSWKEDTTSGSLALSLEPVVERNINATYWFTTHKFPAEELCEMDSRYKLFKSVQTQMMFNYSKRISPNGGNDYWESGVCRPDLILRDIANILHPDHFDDELHYYRQLLNPESTNDTIN